MGFSNQIFGLSILLASCIQSQTISAPDVGSTAMLTDPDTIALVRKRRFQPSAQLLSWAGFLNRRYHENRVMSTLLNGITQQRFNLAQKPSA